MATAVRAASSSLAAPARLPGSLPTGGIPSSLKCPSLCCPSPSSASLSHSAPSAVELRQRRGAVARAAAAAEDGIPAEAAPAQGEEVEYVGNDELLLYFKAEGTLSEAAIPRVTKALEACEGVDNVRVTVLEGCATAECTKASTVQAAAVSSSLVEALQGAGFGLQTVSLGFNDDGSESAAELFAVYTAEGSDLLADVPE